ncbi:branched-chain amino acid ABC transporter permease [Mesorhizobium sp.]|uniref:branched-chain amino acid ABC transporter permease n=1 Tax=Mesorhizobium sp. TaxID=1871066 RepID=UPI000FE8F222|nr:branched-chain amino acid ABC transporter permease [Mesorhizobium sp.]RWJ31997.1 MAG: branched-chain amino acid ABC transporter permease [Mesorhizobium sp.]TIQ73797.1 MAG: branched-chain amino acid ABC transporter permease [Mesorhizobium sp.]
MDALIQIVITGLTLGSMYALAAVGLALTYGTMGMFNMAHGVFMTIGAYAAYSASINFGVPLPLAVLAGIAAGAVSGALLHMLIVRFMLNNEDFQTTIMVATAGVAIALQDLILKSYGAYPFKQPAQIEGSFRVLGSAVSYQSIVILIMAALLIGGLAWLLNYTKFGMAIRATAMNQDAAKLMGVRTERTYLQVIVIAGVLAAAAGILISSLAGLSPAMGSNPLIRAFIICVVAGLGSVTGAGVAAILLGLFEAAISFYFGARFGLPVMLGLVIAVLIFRPAGLFGRQEVVRS